MNKILVVYKKSAYELYNASEDADLIAYVNSDCEHAATLRQGHDVQRRSLEIILSALMRKQIPFISTSRADIEKTKVDGNELVVSVGGDGTFLEVSHYIRSIPLLGVNSHPETSTGFFCCSIADNFEYFLDNIEDTQKIKRTRLARMELNLGGKVLPEPVLNDILVAHENPAANTICQVKVYDHNEADGNNDEAIRHKGSGILVCTPAGSSAWMYNENGGLLDLSASHFEYTQRGVRNAQPHFAEGLRVTSLTRKLCIFVDGPHLKYDFPLGKELHVTKGQPLNVVGDLYEKRKGIR